MDYKDISIIGGGISGLSLAHYCADAGLTTTLVEKEKRVGGAFHSFRTSDRDNAFWLELGAHTCYNSYGNLLDLIEKTGIDSSLTPRERVPFKVLVNGEIKSIASQINYLELLVSVPGFLFNEKAGASVSSYYSNILGKKNYQRLFQHFFNAVPSQDTRDFPADALFKSRPRRKDILKSYTLKGGLQTITDTLADNSEITIHKGVTIESITRTNGAYTLTAADGYQCESKFLAFATPSSVTADLLKTVHPEISSKLSALQSAEVHSEAVVVPRKQLEVPLLAGIVSPNDMFYSAVSRDTVYEEDYRGFTFHFKPDALDRNDRMARICEVLQIEMSDIEYSEEKTNTLPALRIGHQKVVNDIDNLLATQNLFITGNYFAGVAIEDCVSRSVDEFNRLKTLQ
jgi:protoporphyrinogen oxidase